MFKETLKSDYQAISNNPTSLDQFIIFLPHFKVMLMEMMTSPHFILQLERISFSSRERDLLQKYNRPL